MDQTMPDMAAPEPPPPPPAPRLPFRLPAEYYASPERVPVLPRGVPIGCGIASIVFLLAFGALGFVLSGNRGGRVMASLFGMMQSEMDGQFAKDVPAADRKEFDAQFGTLRSRVAGGHVNFQRLQPFLEKMRNASMDEKVTPEETKTLIEALRVVNKDK